MFKKCVCTFYILGPILHSFRALINHWLCSIGSTARVPCRWLPSPGPSVYIWKKKNTQIVERPTNYLIKTNKLAKWDQGARINEKNPDRVTPVQLFSRYGDSLFPDMVPFYLLHSIQGRLPSDEVKNRDRKLCCFF